MYGGNPVLGLGGVFDVGYGYGGRLGHGEAEEHHPAVHHEMPFREPWPEEVYERHRREQLAAAADVQAAADAAIQLSAAIRERLDGHDGIDAGAVVVVTDGGEVTLYGEVADDESRLLAADLIEPIWGVTEVHNLLRVHDAQA
ncbi:MAG: BON domain-containing protein [Nannocystaceae bacterium]